MLNSLCISGSPEEAKVQLEKFRDAGIDLPIIQFNPIGNPIKSFSLLKKTLLDEA
jgi:alkanesulfonate monooxygenase SsuD/methylene tetrahydromethanopterin reductase-like flavin-dependent oxidoreductase (luciferase family)